MTISTTDRTAGPYTGDGVSTQFPFAFKVFQARDLAVYLTPSGSAPVLLTLDVDYRVTLSTNQDSNPGGTVILVAPLAAGNTLTIGSAIAALQPTALTNQGGFYPKVIEDALDRLTIIFQQLGFQNSATGLHSLKQILRYQELEGGGPLPLLADRRNKILGFDDNGNPTSVMPTSDSAQGVRVDLATPSGSAMVGHGATTVKGALDANAASIATNSSDIAANATKIASQAIDISTIRNNIVGRNLSPMVVDLHFGTLCGVGWLGDGNEPGGVTPTPTTSTADISPSGSTIPVASATDFRVNQLICYQGTDSTWYSARIKSISGNVLQLDRTLPTGIALGAQVVFFYANDAHPNIWGYKAIADDAIRQLVRKEEIVYTGRNYEVWQPILPATVTGVTLGTINAASYLVPGASINADRAALVTVADINQGAISDWVALTAGEYNTHLVINQGERTGGYTGAISLSIDELRADGNIYTIANQTLAGFSGIKTFDIGYKVSPGSAVRIRVVSLNSGGATFMLGKFTHGKVMEHPASFNHGTHVLFGDSWFASGFLMSRLQERFPGATFVNKGVGGNKATDLIARFNADVRNSGAVFVWVMCGTNDYYADVTPSLFEQQMNQIAAAIESISAQPIIFNASVGDALYAPIPGERLTVSRQYAVEVNYHAHAAAPDWIGSKYRTNNFSRQAISVPAGGSVLVGAIAGQTTLPAFVRFLATSAAALNVRIGYSGVIDTTTLVDQSTFASGSVVKNQQLPKSDSSNRFVLIVLNNSGGTPITTDICADIAWVQS